MTLDEYGKRLKKYRAEQENSQTKRNNLQNADEDFYLTADEILKLTNKAANLFKNSEPKQKQQLLKLVLQNPTVDDVSLSFTYRKPFDMFAEGSLRSEWLPEKIFRGIKLPKSCKTSTI